MSAEALTAMERATDPQWLARAFANVERLAKTRREFMAPDAWEGLALPAGVSPRVMGVAFQKAARLGLIESTDRFARWRPGHPGLASPPGQPARVWRSLVFGGAA